MALAVMNRVTKWVSGITALAKCIESNPNLKKLNINDNTVTERGAFAIGEALENCKNLETLDMGDCLIRNKGYHTKSIGRYTLRF